MRAGSPRTGCGHRAWSYALEGTDAGRRRAARPGRRRAGVDALVVVGGDGMLHLALQCVAGTDAARHRPAGTGNDFATAARASPPHDAAGGAPTSSPAGSVRTVDAGAPSGRRRWFAGVLSSGFDSAVNERANQMRWPQGRSRYNVAIVAELGCSRRCRSRITVDGETIEREAMLVAVGNGTSYGGGMKVVPGGAARRRAAARHGARQGRQAWSSCGSSRGSTRAPTSTHPAVDGARRPRGAAARRLGPSPTPTASASARCPVTATCVPGPCGSSCRRIT